MGGALDHPRWYVAKGRRLWAAPWRPGPSAELQTPRRSRSCRVFRRGGAPSGIVRYSHDTIEQSWAGLMRFTRRPGQSGSPPRTSEWLGLGEASRLLGVAPGTLRRWSDTGRVRAFTTPGGHRRFRRSALERLIPPDATDRPSLVRSGVTPSRLARAYRAEARAAARQMPWLVTLDDAQRGWFREHGRQLAALLLRYLDAPDEDTAADHLAAATGEAAAYGRMASGLGVSLSQAVEGFLQFRRPFLHELSAAARRRGFDTAATTDLIETADRAMDRLLVASMAAHSVTRVRHGSDRARRADAPAGPS